ncbi:hypothetical protein B0T24DRAFT_617592 [Lasiosphaeria ovina]|uniref:WD40 repeat-like protein n=1 Tax=Lasiosphaeria ovina TaxID=92902 RepID=A0AAE0N9Q0_9PEZI|nr:hypothetical protein B0T24DRAFT_617592 [Lasiosphaeria ovina]
MRTGSSDELVSSKASRVLALQPSCVEFCPAFPSFFLIGTYSLQTDDDAVTHDDAGVEDEDPLPAEPAKAQSRDGSIIVFRVSDTQDLIEVQSEPQPSAILDLHFNPNAGKHDICGAVSSTATLAVFRLSPGEAQTQPLKHLKTMDISTLSGAKEPPTRVSAVLFLSFCWHPTKAELVGITTSTGHVYLVNLGSFDENWKLHSDPVITHTLESWCVAIRPYLDPAEKPQESGTVFTVLSGGDDSALRFRTCTYDTSSGVSDDPLPATMVRGHEAGVTAILPLPPTIEVGSPGLVVTGSYDEYIRLFSITSTSAAYDSPKPKCLAESRLGGGVWRLKLIDVDEDASHGYSWRARILVSCMHAGVRVVELLRTPGGKYEFVTIGRFEEHQSMNYGSDFQPGWKDRLFVVSTSFYDKLMCLWECRMT